MTRVRKDPSDLIPLKQSTYQVLLALGDEELHGYAVMQELSEMTAGREAILPGTLYAALARMVDESDATTSERVSVVTWHAWSLSGCGHSSTLRTPRRS
jgi:hypothetical protein